MAVDLCDRVIAWRTSNPSVDVYFEVKSIKDFLQDLDMKASLEILRSLVYNGLLVFKVI
jgi:hypothetical protein